MPCESHDDQSKHATDHIHDYRFGEKLVDQLTPECAHYFSNTNFIRAIQRTCRCEIDVIDPGNGKNEECDNAQRVNTVAVALIVGLCFVKQMGVEMNIEQRTENELLSRILF